jgi:hypothetical protein
MRMLLRSRTALVAALVLGLSAPSFALTLPELLRAPPSTDQIPIPTPAQGCCKHCRTGKACGDTCIARDKTCHVGPGCACNG